MIEDPEKNSYFRRPLRLERLFFAHRSFYFVTFNSSVRGQMLARPELHEVFRTFALRAHEQYDIAVGRYILMPDHVHFFVALPPDGITLSKWLQSLRSVLGKELLRIGFQKPHWKEGVFDHLLRSSESYSEKWEYVRMNPVRADLCTEPEQWPYQGEIVNI